MPAEPMPLTWAYARRETTVATAGDTDCPAFKPYTTD